MKFIKCFILLPFLLSCQSPVEFYLQVAVLQEEDYPMLKKSDVEEIFESAQKMIQDKLGAKVHLEVVHYGQVSEFFKQVIEDNNLVKELPKLSVHELKKEWHKNKGKALAFLKRNYTLKQLQVFFKAKNYEKFWEFLGKEYLKKFSILQNYRLKNGSRLWTKKREIHSYQFWKKIMYYQKSYDLILTNIFIFYDNVEEPYPHAILKHAKVSGSSFDSPSRKGILLGTASLTSVFELYSNEDYFLGPRTLALKNLPASFKNKAIGGYLLAHELAHQLFWIPDVYDHPEGCLMDTRFENMEIGYGYELLRKNPQVCPICQKYVYARKKVLLAQKQGSWEELAQSLKDFPSPNDKNIEKLILNIKAWYSP